MSALEQAQVWRSKARPERRDKLSLDDLTDDALVAAYRMWWHTYTRAIRESGSVNSPVGVTEHDARAAGDTADRAVLTLNLAFSNKDEPYRYDAPDGAVGDCSDAVVRANEQP